MDKKITCVFNFENQLIMSIIEDSQIRIKSQTYCPFASMFVDPTECGYSKKCKFQKRV